ncbi:MAG: M1 family metallopeptidase [Streptococcaceae bacterium]|jgi:aminopeptidase N|nr:M1 family metallopeptidase [Streptococcaceae bacterium]
MAVKRLIENFIPENYKILLDIDREAKVFRGQVTVTGEAKDVVVSFHQKGLKIKKVHAFSVDTEFIMNYQDEEVVVKAGQKGPATISFEYEGDLTDNMMGIYPSYYEVDGVKKQLIGTQFESHFARQAFPCIDEPEAKATFDLSVKWDEEEGETIVSNMPEKSVTNGYHNFETTVKMSSYLLAFVFGEMQAKFAKTKSGVEVGTFSTKAHAPEVLDFPLDIAVKAIEFYEDYYQTPYPLAHSYHIALPDFSAGAMENWGCITYREVCMLVDPENSTEASRQYVATVITHELAHQWFGDLVTMRWWDDLWLNESFAENMMHLSVDAIHPEWKIWEKFGATDAQAALTKDATDGVQSVHVDVTSPDEINTLFDPAIVYAKGARLMSMLRFWLGDKDFAAGLKQYFADNQYSNTMGDDLWKALSDASGRDVATFMHSWINQPGYPLVSVKFDGKDLTISQEQFFIGAHSKSDRLWQVPLNSNYDELPEVLSEKEIVIKDFTLTPGKPLLINHENTGHYLVKLDENLLSALTENFALLDDMTKFQLLQDRKYLAKSGLISYDEVIELLPLYQHETSYLVELAVSQLLSELDIFIDEDTEADRNRNALTEKLFVKSYEKLGWEAKRGESSDDESLRTLVLSALTKAENADAVGQARTLFAAHKSAPETLPAAVRPIVLVTEIRASNSAALSQDFVTRYAASTSPEYKDELATAATAIKDQTAIETILSHFKDAEVIKPQDLSHWYFRLVTRDFAQDTAWAWTQENWTWLKDKLGGDMSFDYFVVYTARAFKTQEKLEEFKTFFMPKLSELGLKRNIELGINNIEARVALIQKEKVAVENALKKITSNLR